MHGAKASNPWFKDHGIPVLHWPANSPDPKEEDAIAPDPTIRRAEGLKQPGLS